LLNQVWLIKRSAAGCAPPRRTAFPIACARSATS